MFHFYVEINFPGERMIDDYTERIILYNMRFQECNHFLSHNGFFSMLVCEVVNYELLFPFPQLKPMTPYRVNYTNEPRYLTKTSRVKM